MPKASWNYESPSGEEDKAPQAKWTLFFCYPAVPCYPAVSPTLAVGFETNIFYRILIGVCDSLVNIKVIL